MTLATKNGSIIVKDGKLAEDCGCCGGWYCYTPECPCQYSGTLPATLSMTITVSVPNTIYGFVLSNFLGSWVAPMRYTSSQLQAVNGTYTLTKLGNQGLSPCVYELNSTAYHWQQWDQNQPQAICSIGSYAGLFNASDGQVCNSGQSSVRLVEFGFSAKGTLSTELGNINNFSTLCQGVSAVLNSAASRSYGSQTLTSWFHNINTRSSWSQYGCVSSPVWNNGGSFGGTYPSVLDEYDFPPCVDGNIAKIDHTWSFDLLYTDTSGSGPVRGNVRRAITVRIFE